MMTKIEQLMRSLGIRATYQGYYYLEYSVKLCMEDLTYLREMKKRLYPKVAEHYETKADNVERNLRTVIAVCWDKGNKELLEKIAGSPLKYKPTTGEFIDILVGHLSGEPVEIS